MIHSKPSLIVVAGPTAVGKTDFAIRLARQYGSVVLSADSRQVYKGMEIATAQPSKADRRGVKHYFIGPINPLQEEYSAGRFEREAITLLRKLFKKQSHVIVAGGTGLYIDALIKGLDEELPSDAEVRLSLTTRYEAEGLAPLLQQLDQLDPVYAQACDRQNPRRVIRALEVILLTGLPYSSLRKNKPKQRFFETTYILLERDREELYRRINRRVHVMLDAGLIDEARRWYPFRHLNATNTVGYKELFLHFDGKISRDEAIELLKRNTRRFAKRQMTWFRKAPVDIRLDLTGQ